jgi:orotate phosphoribosyltransferase
MSLTEDRAALAKILTHYSVRRDGEYKLASGRTSDVYCDARVTTCRAAAMPLIGRLFLAKFAERCWQAQAVGGMSMGADPIVIAVARESAGTPAEMNAFLIRKEPKGHGLKRQIEGLSEEQAGSKVIIVDDTCTTGDSTIKAIQAVREAGLTVLGAVGLVDREEGARQAIEGGLGCPFDRIFRIAEL